MSLRKAVIQSMPRAAVGSISAGMPRPPRPNASSVRGIAGAWGFRDHGSRVGRVGSLAVCLVGLGSKLKVLTLDILRPTARFTW